MKILRKGRSLRWLTLVIISLLLASLVIVTSLTFSYIINHSIIKLEHQYVAEHIGRVQKAIEDEGSRLSSVAKDWAPWDDSYTFVEDLNSKYIENNLVDTSLANLSLNFMLFANKNGQVAFCKAIDLSEGVEAPVPTGLVDNLNRINILKNMNPKYKVKGLILLPEGPMIIASHPILKSTYQGPIHGNLIIGHFLDPAEIKRISEKLNLNISVEMLNGNTKSPFTLITPNNPIVYEALSDKNIAGYAVMNNLDGNPAIGIRIETTRGVYAIGQNAVRYMQYSLLVIGFIFSTVLLVFLEKHVLSRLLGLSESVKSIGNLGDFTSRLEKDLQEDELSVLSDEINQMLEKLDESQQIIKKNRDELELRVQERTAQLATSNKALQSEIAERVKMQAEIEYLAYHDYLTDLPNRTYILDQINQAISQAQRTEKALAIMFIDLDEFKIINDTMGHSQGDELLKEVAKRLRETLRSSDTVARLGGDEFIIMLRNLADEKDIINIAEKIISSFTTPFEMDTEEFFITASIGIAMYPTDGETVDVLIKNADIAMYKAKETGRNQFMLCTPLMKSHAIELMKLTNSLHRAVERDELLLHYQPQVSSNNGKIIGFEALLRWHHPELGLISPTKIIPIAEQTGLISSIGEWVLRTACKQNKEWQDNGFLKVRVAVNLSLFQLQNPRIVDKVASILEETGLDAQYLELEITESVAMKETEYMVEILQALKDLGITLSIDDFGTEYSSLNHLKQLPIDRIKIAKPFISGIAEGSNNEAIIKAIIVMADSMGLSAIAEGVETERQLEFLCEHKCDEIQGFYYYKPLPAETIDKLLRGEKDMPLHKAVS